MKAGDRVTVDNVNAAFPEESASLIGKVGFIIEIGNDLKLPVMVALDGLGRRPFAKSELKKEASNERDK